MHYLEIFTAFGSGLLLGGHVVYRHAGRWLDQADAAHDELAGAAERLLVNVKSFTENPATTVDGRMIGLSLAPDMFVLSQVLEKTPCS